MNARKTIMMTLLGTAGLALAASGAYAQTTPTYPTYPDNYKLGTTPMPACNKGTIEAIGAGYNATPGIPAGIYPRITLKCEVAAVGYTTAQLTKTFSVWPAWGGTYVYATALTALVENRPVSYSVWTATPVWLNDLNILPPPAAL